MTKEESVQQCVDMIVAKIKNKEAITNSIYIPGILSGMALPVGSDTEMVTIMSFSAGCIIRLMGINGFVSLTTIMIPINNEALDKYGRNIPDDDKMYAIYVMWNDMVGGGKDNIAKLVPYSINGVVGDVGDVGNANDLELQGTLQILIFNAALTIYNKTVLA